MSEPTGGDDQNFGADQGQTTESFFSDPTAPVWADAPAPSPIPPAYVSPPAPTRDTSPVAPVPPVSPGPPSVPNPYAQQPAEPYASPSAAPPTSNPYAQQPPVQPYGQPPIQPYGQPQVPQYGQPQVPQYGQPQVPQYDQPPAQQYGQPQVGEPYPSYGQPQVGQPYPAQQYGQQYPGYGQQPLMNGAPKEANGSAIALTIISVLSLCAVLPIASMVLGIVALAKNAQDPQGSRKLTNIGWIVFGVAWVLVIGFFFIVGATSSNTGGSSGVGV